MDPYGPLYAYFLLKAFFSYYGTPTIIAAFVALGGAGFYHWNNNEKARHKRDQEYVAVWTAALAELLDAINRIEGLTRRFLVNKEYMLIELVVIDGIEVAYIKESRHPEITKKIIDLYKNVNQFRTAYRVFAENYQVHFGMDSTDNRRQSTKNLYNLYFGIALWIGRNRQAGMAEEFDLCYNALIEFCKGKSWVTVPVFDKARSLDIELQEKEGETNKSKHGEANETDVKDPMYEVMQDVSTKLQEIRDNIKPKK